MTNEMKLLTALCEAQGFDVEKVCVNQDKLDALYAAEQEYHNLQNKSFGGMLPLRKEWIDPIYEYKLTKRGEQ